MIDNVPEEMTLKAMFEGKCQVRSLVGAGGGGGGGGLVGATTIGFRIRLIDFRLCV